MGEYRTIVADPPWPYGRWGRFTAASLAYKKPHLEDDRAARRPLPYTALSVAQIAALPVADLAAEQAHCYLWVTSRYLPLAFGVIESWGFTYSQTLVWAKTPRGIGPGGRFSQTTEFILFGWRGSLGSGRRLDTSWFNWKRTTAHSKKPEAFQDMVEQVSPGPFLELFARRQRLGWDVWGNEVDSTIALAAD